MSLNPARLDQFRTRLTQEIDDGVLPSCQVAVGLDGEVAWTETFGDASDDTRYVFFSCTKALIAGVMWQLFDEGHLTPDDLVADHFTGFGANGKGAVTVAHLMTHTSGFPRAPLGPRTWGTREARREAMEGWRLSWEPGTQFEYHPTSAHWVLGELINIVDGRTAGESIAARIAEPLGLSKLALGVPADRQGDIATIVDSGSFPTAAELEAVFGVPDYDLGEVTPEVLLGFNHPDARAVGVPGGGGVSTAADLALYYQALLHNQGGLWNGPWLADGTSNVRNMFPDPVLRTPASRSLGLVVANDDGKSHLRGMGHTVSAKAFGHNGAGGQVAWADPATGLSFVYLTNGIDRNFLRESRRVSGVASRAGLLAAAD